MAPPRKKPVPTTSLAEKELDRLDDQFNDFKEEIKALDMNTMSKAPVEETEPQTKMSQNQIANALNKPIYLKPAKSISCKDKFNENYRDQWNFSKEYVPFIAEHNEMKGDEIEIWTKKFAGIPAEYWKVPTNKPVMGPRYLAEQIRSRCYRRLAMNEKSEQQVTGRDGLGTWTGQIIVENTINRLNANPVSNKRSIFTGDSSFA